VKELTSGSVVLIDAGQAFLVMEKQGGFTIAEFQSTGIELKAVTFKTLSVMQEWFQECESKISKILPYEDFMHNVYLQGEHEPERLFEEATSEVQTLESLCFSVKTYNALKRSGVNFESDIRNKSYQEITKIRNLGRKSLEEIERVLNIKFI